MADVIKFESRDAASAAAAARIAGHIDSQLQRDDQAHIVVSGGTTPGKCFGYLSAYELAWDKVEIALSDERWVPNDHDDSNEKLVRETLLVNAATAASILPIYQEDMSVDERCDSLQDKLPKNGFASSLVGMGADGHFASLFPDADCLDAGLSVDNHRFYMPVRTAASPHPRISMTLHALLQSDEILLLFFGDDKLAVFEAAIAGDKQYPITTLLEKVEPNVTLYWAP
jgi:6-phosphogluconolactonase